MAKIQRNFRVEPELNSLMIKAAEAEGITVSQFIEMACYKQILSSTKTVKKPIKKESGKKTKVLTVYVRTTDKIHNELMKIIREKNTTISQEINYILRASLTNSAFDRLEFIDLYSTIKDVNRLGNLLKLSLKNNLNTPVLLTDIGLKINELNRMFSEYISLASHRNIRE